MKKINLLLVLCMFLGTTTTVFADNTTTITTTVPAAEYVLNIPADQEIVYGATTTSIGNLTVTNAKNFGEGKNLEVTVEYSPFASETVETTIPFSLQQKYKNSTGYESTSTLSSGKKITFKGTSSRSLNEKGTISQSSYDYNIEDLLISISADNWGKALAGEYSTTITFTAEVVIEE